MSKLKDLVFEALANACENSCEILSKPNYIILDELKNLTTGFECYPDHYIEMLIGFYRLEVRIILDEQSLNKEDSNA